MSKLLVSTLTTIVVLFANSAVSADTITLTPQLQTRKQVCFLDRVQGYVASFDGKKFQIYVLVHGCAGRMKLPFDCSPYLLPKGSAPPAELLKSMTGTTLTTSLTLRYEFDQAEVAGVEFNEEVSSTCQPRRPVPQKKRQLPDSVWIQPTRVADDAVVDRHDLETLGVQGQFIGMDWSKFGATAVRVGDRVTFPGGAGEGFAKLVNEKIALGGVVTTPAGTPEYHIVSGVVEFAGAGGLVMKVADIVQVASTARGIQPGKPSGVPLRPVKIRVQQAATREFSWLGNFRGLTDEMPLDLRAIRGNGERIVEVATASPLAQVLELIRLKRVSR